MNNDEYVIINKTQILKRIEELKQMKEVSNHSIDCSYISGKQAGFEIILSQSTLLIPEIDKAYWAGMQFVGEDKGSPNEYISNLKLDI